MTLQDWKVILELIGRSPIKGSEAIAVAVLTQKIQGIIAAMEKPPEQTNDAT